MPESPGSRRLAAVREGWTAIVTFIGGLRLFAAFLMFGGVALAGVGAFLCWGLGTALLVLGGLFVLLALLLGWE